MWFSSREALLDRLVEACREPSREVVFLVGAPLCAPARPGKPGVPNVAAMIGLIEDRYADDHRALSSLRQAIETAANPYQAALRHLLEHRGPSGPAQLVREAVLRARHPEMPVPDPLDYAACMQLENDLDGWAFPPGAEALGELVAQWPEPLGGTLLTSNFDPLVELAIRRAEGRCFATVLHGDASLEQSRGLGCHVVHLHGYWIGIDTLHTPIQLTQPRPQLQASLGRLLKRSTVVVMAYGGWDDVFTRTVRKLVTDQGEFLDLVWTFYEDDEERIRENHPEVLKMLDPAIARGRALLYAGVDCHAFLPALLRELDGEMTGRIPAPDRRGETVELVPDIRDDTGFPGRRSHERRLLQALEAHRAVQLLGDRRMGKSTLLRWLQQHPPARAERTAFVNARGLTAPTTANFILTVADAVHRREEIRTILHRHGTPSTARDAEAALKALTPINLLVDDADALANDGNDFDRPFFDTLQELTEQERLTWISGSERDLLDEFGEVGVHARFLEGTERIRLGALNPDQSRQVMGDRLQDPDLVERAVYLAGGIPLALQWLGEALSDRPEDVEDIEAEFRRWIWPIFRLWWRSLDDAERSLLYRAASGGVPVEPLSDELRARGRSLAVRGLLLEREDTFVVEGLIWKAFVLEQEP